VPEVNSLIDTIAENIRSVTEGPRQVHLGPNFVARSYGQQRLQVELVQPGDEHVFATFSARRGMVT